MGQPGGINFIAHYATHRFQPHAQEFGELVDDVATKLPSGFVAGASVWDFYVTRRTTQKQKESPFKLVIKLELDRVTVVLSASNGPFELSKQWTGTLGEAAAVIPHWVAELIALDQTHATTISFSIDL